MKIRILHVERRIHIVNILLIQLLPQEFHGLTESLEMDDFPLSEEFYHIVYIGIIRKPKNIVVGYTRLLLWFIT